MMTRSDSDSAIVQVLLIFGGEIDPLELFPTLEVGATELVLGNPYAFALAVCLDRGMKADVIWTIPYYIRQELGHLDPHKIHEMDLAALSQLLRSLPRRPRYIDAAPRTIQELTSQVIDKYSGDASQMWRDKSAAAVRRSFQNIHGVGPGISSMAVLLIEKAFGIRFSDYDHRSVNTKTRRSHDARAFQIRVIEASI